VAGGDLGAHGDARSTDLHGLSGGERPDRDRHVVVVVDADRVGTHGGDRRRDHATVA
jgi:hypothetical protein